MFRNSRPEPTPAALAVLGVALAGYSIFTADLTVPKESELTQVDGIPTEVARSRYQLTFRVESTAGKRVLHYPHSLGDSTTIRNLLDAPGSRPMRFGYLPASAGAKDLWGNSYDTLYLLKVGEQEIRAPSDVRTHRQQVLGIKLAISGALLFFAWRRARGSS